MDKYYSFVYKGILAESSLEKLGRFKNKRFTEEDKQTLAETLSYDFLESDLLADAERMSMVYIAIHSFENMVRNLVKDALTEEYQENWWDEVPNKIKQKVGTRMKEDSQFRWHGTRGSTEITYCDFGDLSSIIATNWPLFESVLVNLEWAKQILDTLEKSRNIVMHGGVLQNEDIERIGMNIRDWIRQTG